ncbi:hypothetical protein [Paenibacillus cisolokensis]|nr:hypothetical protein [Paenibacillus cisolokensis]
MDRGIRVKNAERKAQYRRDTSPGPVISYNVTDRGLTESFVMAARQGGRWRELAGRYRYADG